MKIKEKIELAKKVAEEQVEKACTMEFYDDDDMVWFEHNDIHVLNPWTSECCRFEYSDAKAVEVYGLANVMNFIERVASKMENQSRA